MDPNSGKIYQVGSDEAKALEKKLGRRLVPVTDEEAKMLQAMPNRAMRREWAKQHLSRAERKRRRQARGF